MVKPAVEGPPCPLPLRQFFIPGSIGYNFGIGVAYRIGTAGNCFAKLHNWFILVHEYLGNRDCVL
jgi:hypothetical protein